MVLRVTLKMALIVTYAVNFLLLYDTQYVQGVGAFCQSVVYASATFPGFVDMFVSLFLPTGKRTRQGVFSPYISLRVVLHTHSIA